MITIYWDESDENILVPNITMISLPKNKYVLSSNVNLSDRDRYLVFDSFMRFTRGYRIVKLTTIIYMTYMAESCVLLCTFSKLYFITCIR